MPGHPYTSTTEKAGSHTHTPPATTKPPATTTTLATPKPPVAPTPPTPPTRAPAPAPAPTPPTPAPTPPTPAPTPSPPSPSPSSDESGDDKSKSSIFNPLTTSEFFRLAYSYGIFMLVAVMLVKFQPHLAYPHIFIMTTLYIIFTLVTEFVWLYAFTIRLRSKQGKNFTSRDTIHNILHNILPFTILVFGYVILVDGFKSTGFTDSGEAVEFYIRGVSCIVFLITYLYLFYNLMTVIDNQKVKSSLSGSPTDDWTKEYPDNKATKYDFLLDVLYSLFQPVSIIIIAGIMYYIIRATNMAFTQ